MNHERLADFAVRLSGLLCRTLSWRPADFWESTPAEISTIFMNPNGSSGEGISRSEFDQLMEQDEHG